MPVFFKGKDKQVVTKKSKPKAKTADKILTKHPQGKSGKNIDQDKYDTIKAAIFEILKKEKEVNFTELGKKVRSKVGKTFPGAVMWYYTTVKLDLEARGVLARRDLNGKQMVRMKK